MTAKLTKKTVEDEDEQEHAKQEQHQTRAHSQERIITLDELLEKKTVTDRRTDCAASVPG